MARGDFKILNQLDPAFSTQPIVAAGAVTTILAGTPTKFGSAGAVVPMVDGDGTTSQVFTGIAKSDSTDTVAAAGIVELWLPMPGLRYTGKSKSAAATDTQAEIDALFFKRVVFDLTTGVWTVDSAAADNVVNGLLIVGGDYRTSTLNFLMRENVSLYNPTT